MKVENAVQPDPTAIPAFLAVKGEVAMLNLLKFRERAVYEDGRATELSGEEAYDLYAAEMRKLVEASGGRFAFGADVVGLLLGEVEELWDAVGIAVYPSPQTLLEIATSDAYRAIEVHRIAGLAGQLNLTCHERELG